MTDSLACPTIAYVAAWREAARQSASQSLGPQVSVEISSTKKRKRGDTMASNGTSSNGNSSNHHMDWETNSRWNGVTRPYSGADVEKLRGSVHIDHTLAKLGAERLWKLLHEEEYVPALGAMTGNQAVQQVKAGLKAIYVSGWQVAADANDSGQMYPDQSLYPADSVPNLVRRINQALMRADQVHHGEGKHDTYWFAPMIADAEAGLAAT